MHHLLFRNLGRVFLGYLSFRFFYGSFAIISIKLGSFSPLQEVPKDLVSMGERARRYEERRNQDRGGRGGWRGGDRMGGGRDEWRGGDRMGGGRGGWRGGDRMGGGRDEWRRGDRMGGGRGGTDRMGGGRDEWRGGDHMGGERSGGDRMGMGGEKNRTVEAAGGKFLEETDDTWDC